ncbi:hypothetical protein CJF42_15280 [Pseudoalteromonas sp. NBT06-2]|uniref:FecR family protein n=1 Tax=Pseudoalteromonas sp. NBT06-2 TaxID=2025950 RepID=UPI000BA6A6C9|nr:FecR family protein [Pseudoalteromonas sp. NBT06-2]PAJ73555.1 hypothetical protein CJF42_15280 [Pseudoalteromonas sp. NBT06-2]
MNNRIKNKLFFIFTFCIVLTAPIDVLASKPAGKTIIAKGKVNAIQVGTTIQRKLKRRAPIFDVDLVKTDVNSQTQFKMLDGGMVALKENSELLISEYEFNVADKTGSVTMELIKGGLRSVTGAIKSEKGNYKLKTPIGSIGIRGTHYEIEIINGELLIAVWKGVVDINIDVGVNEQNISLGEGKDFSYAKIDEVGEVTELLLPPDNFNEGHSSDPQSDSEDDLAVQENDIETQDDNSQSELVIEVSENVAVIENPDVEESDWIPEPAMEELELIVEPFQDEVDVLVPPNNLAELILEKTGSVTYDNISEVAVNSSLGQISNFQASMTINFDNGTIPTGHLVFDDALGEWFAAFNGIINVDSFEMNINFASHGNNKADGDIEAFFLNDLNHTLTNFSLYEIDNKDVTANGSFRVDNVNIK